MNKWKMLIPLWLGVFTFGVGMKMGYFIVIGDLPLMDLLDTSVLILTGLYVVTKILRRFKRDLTAPPRR